VSLDTAYRSRSISTFVYDALLWISGLYTGGLERQWTSLYRFLFALLTTFWLLFIRVFLVRASVPCSIMLV
jgi:hypothetical protein